MEVRIQPRALRDLEAGARFYEKREPGLGRYFAETLWAEIQSLANTAGIHPKMFEQYHKFVSATFPYTVYYRIDLDIVRVYAVYPGRRNPDHIRRRLR